MEEPTTVGQRIASYRRRRGLTQQVLAGLVGRTTSWLSKVERGELTIDRVSLILALANVLKIEPSQLIGGITLPANGGAPTDPPKGIPAIRRAVLAVRAPDDEPLDAATLRAEVERINREHVVEGRYQSVALALPELLDAGRVAVAHEVPGAWWCLADAYRMASSLARGLGEVELAWIAADRAVTAAQRSGDPLLVALSEQLVANALMRHGWLDEAATVCSDAVDGIAPTSATTIQGWAVWGTVHLTQAVAAVRGGDAAAGWHLLRDAEIAAQRVGPGRNDYWEAFGPANLNAISVTIALETGDVEEALRIADDVDLADLPNAGRRARYLCSVAQAQALRRDDGATVALLLEAEHHSAEEIQYSVLAHELVRVCLSRERRSRTPGLRGLAARIGITN